MAIGFPYSVLGSRNALSALPVSSNIVVWYDANDAATISVDSGRVSQWADKSGNGNSLIQATAGNRPAYSSNALNGKPGISFAIGQTLKTGGIPARNDFTLLTVYVPTRNVQNMPLYNGNSGGNGWGLLDRWSGGNYGMLFGGMGFATTNIAHVPNAAALVTAVRSATTYNSVSGQSTGTLNIRVNQVSGFSNSRGQNGVAGDFTIGSSDFAGSFHEVLFYNRALSGAEISSMESYLKTKWGI